MPGTKKSTKGVTALKKYQAAKKRAGVVGNPKKGSPAYAKIKKHMK